MLVSSKNLSSLFQIVHAATECLPSPVPAVDTATGCLSSPAPLVDTPTEQNTFHLQPDSDHNLDSASPSQVAVYSQ